MGAIRTITHRQEQRNGMPLGGLGTGSVEIMPDGSLSDWQIFNLGEWACTDPEKCGKEDLPEYGKDVLPFYVRTKTGDGTVVVRRLDHGGTAQGFRTVMYSFLKSVDTIHWTPDFPVCRLRYEDAALPVQAEAEFASPFVPHDEKTSGMPGFYITFSFANPADTATEVSVLGTLKNPVNRGCTDRMLRNEIFTDDSTTTLLMGSRSAECREQNGSMALSVTGGERSYIIGDYADFFGAYVLGGEYGISEESCLFGFRDAGALPDLGWEERDEGFLRMSAEEIARLPEVETDRLLESVKRLASGHRPWKRLEEVRPDLLGQAEGKRKFLSALLEKYQEFERRSGHGFGDGALCSKVVLQPGETRTIRFLVTWNFPHHISPAGEFVGHRYNCWHENARETAVWLTENAKSVLEKVHLFSQTLQNCSAPAEFTGNWVVQAGTLLKCSWWAKNGDFGVWEGLGSCGFHTMDITYYASFLLLALFPGLQLGQMKMGLKFQREDGRVHHFFTPDFSHVDDGYDRVDMNPQFVLMVCRDYLWTGDRAYLEEMWEPVMRAMDSIEKLDQDGDGLPDQGTRANTYDAWHFRGTPAYIAGLWLASLSAAIRLAGEMNADRRKGHWESLFAKGEKSFQKLWNGEYFSLWKDGEERDECLMSGQLDAAWYCKLTGICGYTPDEQTDQVLRQVWKHNYTEEGGLVNASYPAGKRPTLYTYGNVQVEANWSGVEYAIAGMLLETGHAEWARELAGNVWNRYERAGRIFNHEECGGHYYRPLSAWTLMLSLSGLRINAPQEEISVNPAWDGLRVPWFTQKGYGILEKTGKSLRIQCLQGELTLKALGLPAGMAVEKVLLNGEICSFVQEGGKVRFAKICMVGEGTVLEMTGGRAGDGDVYQQQGSV